MTTPLVYAVPTAGKTTALGSGVAPGWLDTDQLASDGWPAGARLAREGLVSENDLPFFYRAIVLTVADELRSRAQSASGVITNVLAADLADLVIAAGGPRLHPIAIVTRRTPDEIKTLLKQRNVDIEDATAAAMANDAIDAARALRVAFPSTKFIELDEGMFLSDVWRSIAPSGGKEDANGSRSIAVSAV